MNTPTFYIVSKNTSIMYKEKGSKFLAFSFFVDSEEAVKTHLLALKKEHPSATHHCYAWTLGTKKVVTRANDDGEPANTAGKPILTQIQSHGLVNCLVVVVRYFGGTLLGVHGLIQAYRAAAAEVIAASVPSEFYPTKKFKITCVPDDLSVVMRALKQCEAKILKQDFTDLYEITFDLKEATETILQNMMKDMYQVNLTETN